MARTTSTADKSLQVTVKPFGPTTDELLAIGARVAASAALKKFGGASKLRLLYTECLDDQDEAKVARPLPPGRFRATFYDDLNQRAILAEGPLDAPGRIILRESGVAPSPSEAEFEQAVKLLTRDRDLGALLNEGRLQAYQPIPALFLRDLHDGRSERHIAVGLLPRADKVDHEIVAVDLRAGAVTRFDSRTPSHPEPHPRGLCGAPASAGQQTAGKGAAGQVWITVKQGGQTLWRFLAVRPAASSGTNGSAIELRYVDYKGKRVLYRAPVVSG